MKPISTGQMLTEFVNENKVSINDVAKLAGVSYRTIYRVLNDETKISEEVAEAFEKVIPGLKAKSILVYDAKYQYDIKARQKENGMKDAKKKIKFFSLERLYPEHKLDIKYLLMKGESIFGKENFSNLKLQMNRELTIAFSKANGAKKSESVKRIMASLKEYNDKNDVLSLNENAIESLTKEKIKETIFAQNFVEMSSKMKDLCTECGINFYWRNSIPSSRIMGASLKDEEGHVYLLMSILFNNLERFALTFIHEMMHIINGDLNVLTFVDENDEKKIEKETIEFLIGDKYKDLNEIDDIYNVSKDTRTPVGIVAEIYRCKNNVFRNYEINHKLIRRIKQD